MKKCLFYILLLCLCGAPLAFSAEVTVAVIAPKAGENVKEGTELIAGAKLAVDELNTEGGLLKHKIDLLTVDDRCDDRLAVSTAEMLSLLNSKKVVLVIGPYCAERYDDIAQIYEEGKIFQIVPTTVALHADDPEKKDKFILLNTKTRLSTDFFEFYNHNFAGLKVGFVYDSTLSAGYEETAAELQTAFRRFGKAELLKFYPYTSHKSETKLAKRLKNDDINVILIVGRTKYVTPIINASKDKNKNLIVFTNKKNLTPELINNLSSNANGLYALDIADIKDDLGFTETLVNLRLSGASPEGLEAYGYTALKLWSELVKQTKKFDYSALINKVKTPEQQEKWQNFLMHSGKADDVKYTIEMYKDGDFKQVY